MAGSSAPIRLGIVNDHQIIVAGLAALLAPFSDDVAVVELDSKLPVVQDVDVVLYDSFSQAQGGSIDLGSLTVSPTAKVVVFSWNTDPGLVQQTLDAGVAGYLSKAVSAAELVDALRRVHRGERVTPPAEPRDGEELGTWPGEDAGLNAREAEVLALICQGLSNEEIAARAFIGVNTVKFYIRSLYRKIKVDSRTQAVLWGVDHGFRPVPARLVSDG